MITNNNLLHKLYYKIVMKNNVSIALFFFLKKNGINLKSLGIQ